MREYDLKERFIDETYIHEDERIQNLKELAKKK